MVNDLLLLHYAMLNDSVGFNAGHRLMFRDGVEIGRVPCLAICQDKDSPQFMLYYCDGDWKPLGIASYDSVDAAKSRAERIYPGSIACWTQAQLLRRIPSVFLKSSSPTRDAVSAARGLTKLWLRLLREREKPEFAEIASENSAKTSMGDRSTKTKASKVYRRLMAQLWKIQTAFFSTFSPNPSPIAP